MQFTGQLREVVRITWENFFAISAGLFHSTGGSAARVLEAEAEAAISSAS